MTGPADSNQRSTPKLSEPGKQAPEMIGAAPGEQHAAPGSLSLPDSRPSRRYRTIVADPPWHYPFGHPAREHKKHPYPTLTIGELCELPVSDWADQSAHLYLWTTNEHLRFAFQVLGAWGFTFKNVLVWCKPGLGMGGTFRNSHEIVLLGERGRCDLKRRNQGTWFALPNPRENSAKPDGFLDLVESVSHGPYLELFARRQRLGWDTWGDEALQHVEIAWPA